MSLRTLSSDRREIDLAGDVRTMPEAAEILTEALGRPIAFAQTPIEQVRQYSKDMATARVEVAALKPDKPVCQLKFQIANQRGEVVLEAEAWTYTLRPDLEGPPP